MREYLQIIIALPATIFYFLKFTSYIWLIVSSLSFGIIKFTNKFNEKYLIHLKYWSFFFLNLSQRYFLSPSNFYKNTPEVYSVSYLETASFIISILFSYFFFQKYKTERVKIIFILGIILSVEIIISFLSLYLNGFSFFRM